MLLICASTGSPMTTVYSSETKERLTFLEEQEPLPTSFIIPDIYNSNDTDTINSGLISYFLAICVAEDALSDFINSKYNSFDALIGNNSCYISSYIIFLISQSFYTNNNFSIYIQSSLEKIRFIKHAIIAKTNNFKEKIEHKSLYFFLKESGFLITLEIDCIYLIMAYGCAQSKIKNEFAIEEISHEKLLKTYSEKLRINIGRKSAQKLIKHWQKSLSIFNIQILQSHAKTLCKEKERLWANYVINDIYILEDGRGRLCAASLYTAAVVYDKLTKIPGAILGLQVNLIEHPKTYISKINLYFEVQEDGNIQVIDQDYLASTRPVYMFTGCRHILDASRINIEEIKQEFKSRDLRNLILAHEVTYPQYPKSLNAQDIAPLEPALKAEIAILKEMSGFSIENPTDLCLVHMFVSQPVVQSFLAHEAPVYLPQLKDYRNRTKSNYQAEKCGIV